MTGVGDPVLQLKGELRQMVSQIPLKSDILQIPLSENNLIVKGINRIKESNIHSTMHDFRFCLECAAKDILYELLQDSNSHPMPSDFDISLQPLFQLLDFILLLAEAEICDQTLPLSIIEEMLDAQTIEGCQRVFSYLESRFERLTVGIDGSKGKGLFLLRLSNELLRRLSKSDDTVFCGRILVFLSKSFPLCERSGVNLRGEFNTENITNFESVLEDNAPLDAESHTINTSDSSDDSIKAQIFYPAFWSMQSDFADPTRLFNAEHFQNFKSSLRLTLRAFKTIADEQAHQGGTHLNGEYTGLDKGDHMIEDDLDRYNPKYLTSRELFELEVRDLVFRRHVLVQAYILIEFLLTLSPESKKKLDIEAKNRSVQYGYTLSDDDLKWAEDSKRDISIALQQEKGMDGLLFSRTVDSVLTREKNWVKWKADNCISFEKPTLEPKELEETTTLADSLGHAPSTLKAGLSATTLSKVWVDESTDHDIDDLKQQYRYEVPDYHTFQRKVEQIELDLDFASDAEKGELMGVSSSVTWRALRLASKERFHLFNKLDDDLNLKSLLVVEEHAIKEKSL